MKDSDAVLSAPPVKDISAGAGRVAAIDILRALTMVLMIFVNDLWSLRDIPAWLGHVDAGVDGIGLADVVFPAFLFIVGLSIPYAINQRIDRGDTPGEIFKHIFWRTIALLVMGVFLVNGETINATATGMPRGMWNTLCCLCFILLWNRYPDRINSSVVNSLRGIAIVALALLAINYRGGPDAAIHAFGPQWWGILGLIGWAYLVSSTVTLAARLRPGAIAIAWVAFCALSMLHHAGYIPGFLSFIPAPVRGGTLVALTLGGAMTSLVLRKQLRNITLTGVLVAFSAGLFVLAWLTRPYWGLAKLGATPAWLFLCSAFTIIAFLIIYWIADVYRKEKWFTFVRPAGTDTLLCYLIPYFAYASMRFAGISLPDMLLTGAAGLVKSFLFAMLCVFITGILIRKGVRLKL